MRRTYSATKTSHADLHSPSVTSSMSLHRSQDELGGHSFSQTAYLPNERRHAFGVFPASASVDITDVIFLKSNQEASDWGSW